MGDIGVVTEPTRRHVEIPQRANPFVAPPAPHQVPATPVQVPVLEPALPLRQ